MDFLTLAASQTLPSPDSPPLTDCALCSEPAPCEPISASPPAALSLQPAPSLFSSTLSLQRPGSCEHGAHPSRQTHTQAQVAKNICKSSARFQIFIYCTSVRSWPAQPCSLFLFLAEPSNEQSPILSPSWFVFALLRILPAAPAGLMNC